MSGRGARHLTAGELKSRMDGGESTIVLDVRTTDARTLHPEQVPGSRWMPLSNIERLQGLVEHDTTIATYCT